MKLLMTKPEQGKLYRFEFNGSDLYDATVIEYDGGCWAKIRIDNILTSGFEHLYKPAQTMDVKLSAYSLYENGADRDIEHHNSDALSTSK